VMSDSEVKGVLRFFFRGVSQPTTLNPALRQLATTMMYNAMKASRQMGLVPRPAGLPPGLGWIANQAVQMLWRASMNDGIYDAVRVTVSRNFRSEFEMAKLGI